MARRLNHTKRLVFAIAVMAILVAYQNCSLSPSYQPGEDALASLNKGCDTVVARVFATTYYPFARQNCTGCHDNGEAGSARAFADVNVSSAFDKFQSLGRARVETMMVNPGHRPPKTGPQHQALIEQTRAQWLNAEAQAARCEGTTTLVTSAISAPGEVYTTTPRDQQPWPRLSWDLDVNVADAVFANVVHATFTIEVRRFLGGDGAAVGYQFRNPTLQIKGDAGVPGYRVRGIAMNLNGEDLTSFTSYGQVNAVAAGTAATNLAPGYGAAAAPTATLTAAPTDTFAMRFASIEVTTDQPGPGGGDGGVDPGTQVPVSYADLMSSNQTLGVFSSYCVSCHNPQNPRGSFDITRFANAFRIRSTIQARMNNQQNPMPPSGLLSGERRAIVDRWVNNGAPEN